MVEYLKMISKPFEIPGIRNIKYGINVSLNRLNSPWCFNLTQNLSLLIS